jgi:translocation and assembly module TamB
MITCLGFLLVLVPAAVSLRFWLESDHGRQTVLNLINQRIPGRILMDDMGFSLFRGEIQIHGLGIQGPGDEKVVGVEKLLITFDPSRLRQYELALGKIQIIAPDLHLIKKKNGELNISSCFTDPDKAPGQSPKQEGSLLQFNIILDALSVENGRLVLELEKEQLSLTTDDIVISGSGDLAGHLLRLDLSTGTSTLIVNHKPTFETDRLDLSLAYEKGSLTRVELGLDSQPARLALKGSVVDLLQEPKADLFLEILADLEKTPSSISGTLNAKASLKGTLSQPLATLSVNYVGGKKPSSPLEQADLQLSLENNILTINELKAAHEGGEITGQGDIDLTRAFPKGLLSEERYLGKLSCSLDLQADTFQPGILLEEYGLPGVHGICSFKARLHGSPNNPEASLQLTTTDVGYEEYPPAQADLDLVLAEDHLEIKRLALTSLSSNLNITGRVKVMEKGGPLSYKKMPASLSLSSTRMILEEFFPNDQGMGAEFAFDGNLTGTLEAPKAMLNLTGQRLRAAGQTASALILKANLERSAMTGTLALKGLKIMEKPFRDFTADLGLDQGIARIRGDLGFDLTGSLDTESMDFTTDLTFEKTDLLPWLTLAGVKELEGNINGKIQANGNVQDMEKIQGQVDIDGLLLRYKGEYSLACQQLRARINGREVELFPATLDLPGDGTLTLGAKGRIGDEIKIQAKGKVPAKAAALFTDGVAGLEGHLTTDTLAILGKDIKKSAVTSRIELHDLGMIIPQTGQKIHGMNGLIHATPERVEIPSITGKLDTGDFSLSGNMDLKDFFPDTFQARFQGTALPVVVPDAMEAVVHTDLNLAGNLKESLLRGNITLESGEWTQDFNLEKTALENLAGLTRKEEGPTSMDDGSNPADTVRLDLVVKANTPFEVINDLADLEVNPDLVIKGRASHPTVSGRATLTPGTLTYQGKAFELTKGMVDFTNPYGIEPELDLTAEHHIRDWDIQLSVTGTPENLILTLSSQPREEHGDILSLLLTGKTTNELIRSEGGSTTSPASLLAGIAASSVAGRLKESTGLDILEVELTDTNGDSDLGDVNLTVGKELTENMTVTYGMETKEGDMIQKTTTSYKLSDKMSVSGFQNTEGHYGAEIRYRLEFK